MKGVGLGLLVVIVLGAALADEDPERDVLTEEEEGVVEEDMSLYTRDGAIMYRVLRKPRHCDGPYGIGDTVTMNMEYHGLNKDGEEVEMQQALTTKIGEGQSIRSPLGEGLLGMCLGEKRRLLIPEKELKNKYKEVLPDILDTVQTFLEAEVTGINRMSWQKFESGLMLSMLEPVDPEYCERTVEDGDTLAVEYEGSLEDGTVFDSSASRGAPFGPFVHGRGQIIQGYEEVLPGKCLGERWRMVVPPHLAYGDSGAGDSIPGGATLTFDVRLVKLNDAVWSDEVRNRKVLGWEEIYKPEVCEAKANWDDQLHMHYEATREDGTKFGSLVDNYPPYGPFSLSGDGTFVPALDQALEGMCLGERRMVSVPPRLGWAGRSSHSDTIKVELFLVQVNNMEAERLTPPEGPPKDEL